MQGPRLIAICSLHTSGFLNGAQAQEESIARSSTLYPSLMTSTAQQFYTLHNNNAKSGFYTHAMIYSPNVRVFRDDAGEWVKPMTIDVLTSPAVNAGVVKKTLGEETDPQTLDDNIEKEMKERMGRILFLFEQQGAKHLVLGSFGTGVFQNSISMVATIWAELFNTRFRHSFETVVFAILGQATFTEFQQVFQTALSSDDTSEVSLNPWTDCTCTDQKLRSKPWNSGMFLCSLPSTQICSLPKLCINSSV